MAELLHCSYSAYCRFEAGEIELFNHKLSKAAAILKTTIISLLTTEATENKEQNNNSTTQSIILKSKEETITVLKNQIESLKEQINKKDNQIELLLLTKSEINQNISS